MKPCKHCGETFDERVQEYNPAGELGDMFLETTGEPETEDVCPKCKEELGIINLLGFGE